MDREAERRAAENSHEHRDRRGIGAEVDVQMLEALRPHEAKEHRRLGQVGEVPEEASIARAAEGHRRRKRSRESNRMADQRRQRAHGESNR